MTLTREERGFSVTITNERYNTSEHDYHLTTRSQGGLQVNGHLQSEAVTGNFHSS